MFIIRYGEATCWHLFARSNVARCHGWDSQLEMHTFQRASHFLQICKYSGRPLTLKYDENVTIWKWEYKFSGSLWRGYKTWGTTQQETEKLIVRFILKHILFTLFILKHSLFTRFTHFWLISLLQAFCAARTLDFSPGKKPSSVLIVTRLSVQRWGYMFGISLNILWRYLF